jgi:peptidyl-prolyl cis-trans isomerase B (cyclophilin B)
MSVIVVLLTTSLGDIKLELDPVKAPVTVENFVSYVKSGHYDGTIFHRVIDGFMIQGGGFDKDMKQKPTKDPIKNEANNGLKNEVGTVAMARTQDPHSASAQFFINVSANEFLNFKSESTQGWGYAVFGKVTEGMDVVNKIKGVPTTRVSFYQDVPREPVLILSAKVVE